MNSIENRKQNMNGKLFLLLVLVCVLFGLVLSKDSPEYTKCMNECIDANVNAIHPANCILKCSVFDHDQHIHH